MNNRTEFLGSSTGQVTEEDRRAADTAGKLHSAIQSLTVGAVQAAAKSHQQALIIALMGAVGAVHLVAKIIAKHDGDKDQVLQSIPVLTAALMCYHMAPCESKPGLVDSEFSPRSVLAAFTDFEKLCGQKPDEYLHESFALATRESANDPRMIAAMEAARYGGRLN